MTFGSGQEQNLSSSESIDVYATKFTVNVSGLKPETEHRFYLLDKDVTSDCVPITPGTFVSNTKHSYNKSGIQLSIAQPVLGEKLVSSGNGKLSFEYYFKPENSPFQVKNNKNKGPYVSLPAGNQKVYVKSDDGFSYAESAIKVTIDTKTVRENIQNEYRTCFLPWQKVLMADGKLKEISLIAPGELVRGRWGINEVRGIEMPLLGNRTMWVINNSFYNTWDHPMWTKDGWAVLNKQYYIENDWECECEIFGKDGEMWIEKYTPCSPDKILQVEKDITEIAVYGKKPFDFIKVTSIKEDTSFSPETTLYSLALDGDRTMFVDNYCVSGWANENLYDYDSKVGS